MEELGNLENTPLSPALPPTDSPWTQEESRTEGQCFKVSKRKPDKRRNQGGGDGEKEQKKKKVHEMTVVEMKKECSRLKISGCPNMKKRELKMKLLAAKKGLKTLG